MKARKKPVEIDFWRVRDLIEVYDDSIMNLPSDIYTSVMDKDIRINPMSIDINTLEGEMKAGFDDVIIKGVKGEFYSCKKDIFEATYEILG